jgi:regulatory protein
MMAFSGGRRVPRKVSAESLERSALHYLERFASSAASLRRVLLTRVRRSAREHEIDLAEAVGWIEALIDRFTRSGLLNDGTYAAARVATLHRRGGSTRMIRQKLASKGVDADLVSQALAGLEPEGGESLDEAAALAYARRRRLGPFRPAEDRDARRDKDMAALARAGFDRAVVFRVMALDDPDKLPDA